MWDVSHGLTYAPNYDFYNLLNTFIIFSCKTDCRTAQCREDARLGGSYAPGKRPGTACLNTRVPQEYDSQEDV